MRFVMLPSYSHIHSSGGYNLNQSDPHGLCLRFPLKAVVFVVVVVFFVCLFVCFFLGGGGGAHRQLLRITATITQSQLLLHVPQLTNMRLIIHISQSRLVSASYCSVGRFARSYQNNHEERLARMTNVTFFFWVDRNNEHWNPPPC